MAKPLKFGPYPARIRLTRDADGLWTACAILRTAKGDVSFKYEVNEAVISQALERMTRQRVEAAGVGAYFGDAESGISFFTKLSRSIKAAARKIAASKAIRGVMSVVNKVINNPLVRAVASVIPGAGLTLQAVDAAKNLLGRIEKGSKSAVHALTQIETAARKGHPLAIQSLAAVRSTFEAMDKVAAERPADAISGAELLPYARAEHARLLGGAAAGANVTAPPSVRWLWDELRPQTPYRAEAEAFTPRDAYKGGLDVLRNRRLAA